MTTNPRSERKAPEGAEGLRVGLLLLAVCLALAAVTASFLWQARRTALSQAELASRNLAASVLDQVVEQTRQADLMVGLIVQTLQAAPGGQRDASRLRDSILRAVTEHPTLHELYVYDRDGALQASSDAEQRQERSAGAREFFAFHRANPADVLHVGRPYRTEADGDWVIPLSRRVSAVDGGFAGVVVGVLALERLTAYFEQFDLGPDGLLALNTRDATLLARRPHVEQAIGRSLKDSLLYREHYSRAAAGTFMATSPVDGIERQYSFAHSATYPVMVVVASTKEHVLAGWRKTAAINALVIGGLLLLLAFAGARTRRALVRQRRLTEELQRSNRRLGDLERAIDEHELVSITDVQGRIVHVNDRFCALAGYGRQELLGRDHRMLNSERHPRAFFREMWRTIARGEVWKGEIRNRAKDGSSHWVETTIVPFLDAEGKPYQYIAIRSDITERKRAENEIRAAYEDLARANQQLSRLAAFDELTGLANRRHFDETLADEFKRAHRSATPLSVLMLDVDFFKQFNDSYGHTAGDACLRRVAMAIRHALRRPGDLPARWGGEEFAVLLPQTDAEGALAVAQLVRGALLSQSIEHRGSPLGCVTISVGVHCSMPSRGGPGPAGMMECADRALYAAKQRGRNRAELHTAGDGPPAADTASRPASSPAALTLPPAPLPQPPASPAAACDRP
ncbi:sensor domain-containing diguanylate cyclase [Caldimonas tepidiphila]|uniref:sensor domain-containing diguanylate cyclase n=1 Tax=Caldimonas tepidiphila TaxID=2315841 RepID=UPI001473E55B|nr:diguanylate cyclase [Caldimonas tepidiphila]